MNLDVRDVTLHFYPKTRLSNKIHVVSSHTVIDLDVRAGRPPVL